MKATTYITNQTPLRKDEDPIHEEARPLSPVAVGLQKAIHMYKNEILKEGKQIKKNRVTEIEQIETYVREIQHDDLLIYMTEQFLNSVPRPFFWHSHHKHRRLVRYLSAVLDAHSAHAQLYKLNVDITKLRETMSAQHTHYQALLGEMESKYKKSTQEFLREIHQKNMEIQELKSALVSSKPIAESKPVSAQKRTEVSIAQTNHIVVLNRRITELLAQIKVLKHRLEPEAKEADQNPNMARIHV